MADEAHWEAEAHRTFAQSLLVALREAFPSVPGLAAQAPPSIRPSSCPVSRSLATHIQLAFRHVRDSLEALGGPFDETERRAFVQACRCAWRRARVEAVRLLGGDEPPELVPRPELAWVKGSVPARERR
ncbi:MAG: hypothetical protein AB1486_13550 [Planctomycetota bacterium]